MAHTPGTWIATQGGSHLGWDVRHEFGLFYWRLYETKDNACVVAAAPDMLALCRDLYAEVGKGGDLDWHLRERGYAERLRVLIEKADGKE